MNKVLTFYDFLLEEFNVGNISIDNLNKYLDDMTKGFKDKLFFLDKINLDVLVDFGSADGQMLSHLSKIKPNMKLIGYDIDENMIKQSQSKYPNITFTDNWNEVITSLGKRNANTKKGILLSSVIHEVYSYAGGKNIKKFWNEQVFNNNFDYVIIRDMIPSTEFNKMNIIDVNKIKEKSDPKYLKEFEDEWGTITDNFRTLLHWLLKYKYTDNWERELKENYLPVTIEHFKHSKIPPGWDIIFEEHYTYDYIKKQVKKDFDIDLNQPTHLKMILKNTN